MIHYLVNNKQIYNGYLAWYESFKSGKPVEFYCRDNEYDQLNWTQEPEESLEVLMDRHAHYLRNKYERLIFSWSGGTDSHTIYNVFARNQIHIDEILYKTDYSLWQNDSGNLLKDPMSHANWLKENHWDRTTKITVYDEYDPVLRKMSIPNEDWIFNNTTDLTKYFAVGSGGQSAKFLCERSHAGHHWALITGHEKPRVVDNNGRWYTQYEDTFFHSVLGESNIQGFFTDPVLQLKQSHMLKNLYKKFKNPRTSYEYLNMYNSAGIYRLFCQHLGRHEELTVGISAATKLSAGRIRLNHFDPNINIKNLSQQNLEPDLLARYKHGDPVATNYIKGWYNLASNHEFYKFLTKNLFRTPHNIRGFKPVYSKAYDLGT